MRESSFQKRTVNKSTWATLPKAVSRTALACLLVRRPPTAHLLGAGFDVDAGFAAHFAAVFAAACAAAAALTATSAATLAAFDAASGLPKSLLKLLA
jgi:hypothetical protein